MKRPWMMRLHSSCRRRGMMVRWLPIAIAVFCRVSRIHVEGFKSSHQSYVGQSVYYGRQLKKCVESTRSSPLHATHVDEGEDATCAISTIDDPNNDALYSVNGGVHSDVNGSPSQGEILGSKSSHRTFDYNSDGASARMFFQSRRISNGYSAADLPSGKQDRSDYGWSGQSGTNGNASGISWGKTGSVAEETSGDAVPADNELDGIVEPASPDNFEIEEDDSTTSSILDIIVDEKSQGINVTGRGIEYSTNENIKASNRSSSEVDFVITNLSECDKRGPFSAPRSRISRALPSLKRKVVSKVSSVFSEDDSRNLWRRRHARSLEEGIRREKTKDWRKELSELSSLLRRTQFDTQRVQVGRRFLERTIMGLINALADEVEDLDVTLDSISGTPLWRKEVNEVRVNFSRLGMKPLRMGGCEAAEQVISKSSRDDKDLSSIECADEAFDRIDVDNSGALDSGEIANALARVSDHDSDEKAMEALASELVELYDANGDGVVDREEYQRMVEDMAALQKARLDTREGVDDGNRGPLSGFKKSVQSLSQDIRNKAVEVADGSWSPLSNKGRKDDIKPKEKTFGSIILSDVKLDLRRLAFGGVPLVKSVTPGGPLVLEPLTMTLKGSFNREDVMGSFLLDAGLRLLVARALRVRLRSYRDFVDGAMFFGRRWKMSSKSAPVVEVLGLSNVEFDEKDRMILTGRARIRASPEAPVVTNTFKVRTKIGTRKSGQAIRLVEPELAFVFECPQAWEQGVRVVYEKMKLPVPKRPAPVYSFFPIYSPFKVNDNAGFDMGEDNRLRSIFIKDGALQFEMRAVLRPGRFLGNHYLAFTLPNRTFIITMDRLKEGIRAARRNKKVAVREKKLEAQRQLQAQKAANSDTEAGDISESNRVSNFAALNELRSRLMSFRFSKTKNRTHPKSFFSRFVEGYTLVERDGEAENERLTMAISAWFGRQGSGNSTRLADYPPREEVKP